MNEIACRKARNAELGHSAAGWLATLRTNGQPSLPFATPQRTIPRCHGQLPPLQARPFFVVSACMIAVVNGGLHLNNIPDHEMQAVIWDYYKPRHTHAWNMLVLSWLALGALADEDVEAFEDEYLWEKWSKSYPRHDRTF